MISCAGISHDDREGFMRASKEKRTGNGVRLSHIFGRCQARWASALRIALAGSMAFH